MPRTDRYVQRWSILNKPKQTINNSRRCVAIDVHGFANLHQHPNTANPTCSHLAAISNMAVQSFCCLVGHSNPSPSPWRKRFFLLTQQCFGATYKPLFLVRSWCFGCGKTKNRFETRLCLWTSTGTTLEKEYQRTEVEPGDPLAKVELDPGWPEADPCHRIELEEELKENNLQKRRWERRHIRLGRTSGDGTGWDIQFVSSIRIIYCYSGLVSQHYNACYVCQCRSTVFMTVDWIFTGMKSCCWQLSFLWLPEVLKEK